MDSRLEGEKLLADKGMRRLTGSGSEGLATTSLSLTNTRTAALRLQGGGGLSNRERMELEVRIPAPNTQSSRAMATSQASQTPSTAAGRTKQAREECLADVQDAVDIFTGSLGEAAKKHGRSDEFIRTAAGLGAFKNVNKGHATAWGAFCSKELEKINEGKMCGFKTTLPELLKAQSDGLKGRFDQLTGEEKAALLASHEAAKAETAKSEQRIASLSNRAISKAVDARIKRVLAIGQLIEHDHTAVRQPPEGLQNGGGLAVGPRKHWPLVRVRIIPHTRREKWFEHADHSTKVPAQAAMELEAFAVTGCAARVEKAQKGNRARTNQRTTVAACRESIQKGLEAVLKRVKHVRTDIKMNYDNYEQRIVEKLGVCLVGWPIPSPWEALSGEEVEARKAENRRRQANGEKIYKPRKPRAKKAKGIASAGAGEGDSEGTGEDGEAA
ncbi:hypothetical protein BC834DRAFT_841021 [Gloeopeniophorella convolvens]|nr:hypothetical protein BC834DRAFT_841021 [Gloeopeniophorella convolvens]